MDMWDDTHIIKESRWLTHFKGMIKIYRTIFRFLFCMVVKLGLSHSGKNIHGGYLRQGAAENIRNQEGESNGRLEKTL
jgi:hypothetical protein